MIEKAREALRRLVNTVEATGGIVLDDSGCYVPVADDDWADLGEAYVAACKALEVRPLVDGERSDESQISVRTSGDSVVDAALAMRCFISAIESTGGLCYDGTCFVPEGDWEWVDLGSAYLAVCEAAGYTPLIDGHRSDDGYAFLIDDQHSVARRDTARLVTVPHARCRRGKTCVEHAHNPLVPSCKSDRKGRVLTRKEPDRCPECGVRVGLRGCPSHGNLLGSSGGDQTAGTRRCPECWRACGPNGCPSHGQFTDVE